MNTTAAAPAIGRAPLKEMWLISLGHSLTHWYPATFYLLLPLIGKELGLSYAEIGFIMTAQHAVGALTNIPGGAIVDSIGYKGRLMAISLFWVGFPYLLVSFTHSYCPNCYERFVRPELEALEDARAAQEKQRRG